MQAKALKEALLEHWLMPSLSMPPMTPGINHEEEENHKAQ
jgi:hypothetical protein